MTAIWRNDGTDWKLLAPAEFPDEARLHALVEQAPQTLPLAGSPGLTIVGREVRLGSGYADLLAVEPSGRVAVIEIKLARNAEARRAVIAQVLAYAAYLEGMSVEAFEKDVLREHLARQGFSDVGDAVAAQDQSGQLDRGAFYEGLEQSLRDGDLRLVIVLDSAPDELVRLSGFLERKASNLLVDLVTMSAYEVGGSTILVPQRVEAAHRSAETRAERPRRASSTVGTLVDGADDFEKAIEDAAEHDRPVLRELVAWARDLESRGLVRLATYHGVADRMTLLPRLQPDNVGLVTVWNERGPALQLWRSVFERRAPKTLVEIERAIAPTEVRQGNTLREIPPGLLGLLTKAYEEAKVREVVAVD